MNPTPLDSEQRYWRRRANRRVRKARWLRAGVRWGAVLALHGVVATILIVASVRATERLAASDAFRLREFEIDGARRVDVTALQARLAPFLGQSLLQLDLQALDREIRRDSWVQRCTLRRMLPGSLRVQLHERQPAAVALIAGRAHLVDREGFVIGPTGAGRGDDLPLLRGFEGLEREALVVALRDAVTALLRLEAQVVGFGSQIAELDFSRPDRRTLRLLAPGPELLLDPDRIERNVETYLRLKEQIERRSGRPRHVDLRWTDRIAVLPGEPDQGADRRTVPETRRDAGLLEG